MKAEYKTKPRNAIIEYLKKHADTRFTACDILNAVNSDGEELDRSTIYRNLERLCKEGLRNIQQEAEMIPCVNGDVDLDILLDREDFDFEEVEAYSAVQKALNNCEHDDEKSCVGNINRKTETSVLVF